MATPNGMMDSFDMRSVHRFTGFTGLLDFFASETSHRDLRLRFRLGY